MGERYLEVRNLKCSYGDMVAVERASLYVDRGEIAVILGPNGAGKTTLLKAIAGILIPVSGSIVFSGIDITRRGLYERISMGIRYIPDRDSAFRTLTVEDNLKLVRRDYDISPFPILEKKLRTRAGNLSGGEFKILTLAMAYNSGASLLLIDEPSSGLFQKVKIDVADILKNMRRRGITMVIAEQDAEMAKELGNRIYQMESGILV